MGRYLGGTKRFEYKYAFGEQPSNLAYLHGASGAGRAEFDVAFAGSDEDGDSHDLVDRGEMKIARSADPGEVFARLVARERRRLSRTRRAFEAEHGVVPVELTLEASVIYDVDRADHQRLLDFVVSRCRGADAELAALRKPVGRAALLAAADAGEKKPRRAVERRLGLLAACILIHAIEHRLASMRVWENDTEWTAEL